MRREVAIKIMKELSMALLTMLIISILVFTLSSFSSGDISLYVLGESSTEKLSEEIAVSSGLREPFFSRYISFIRNFFTLDWGSNLQGYSIKTLIISRASLTVELMLLTLVIAIPLSIIISTFSIKNEGRVFDKATSVFFIIILSLPSFSIALLLMLLFSYCLPVFPTSGFVPLSVSFYENLRTMFLPSLSLALMHTALFSRVLKKSLKREMNEGYIIGAVSMGRRRDFVVFTEALRPASISLVSLSFEASLTLLSGSAVTETVFSLPGLGSLLVSASLQRDVRTVTTVIMLLSFFITLIQAISKIVLALLDYRAGDSDE